MKELLQQITGKRTYATVAAGLLLLLGQWLGFYKLPDELYAACLMLALWFIRSAISNNP